MFGKKDCCDLDKMVKIQKELETMAKQHQAKIEVLEFQLGLLQKTVDILLTQVLKQES